MAKKIVFAIVILATCFFLACGRKNSPKPPEQFAPNRVLYPTAHGELGAVVLGWGVPKNDARGVELRNLAGFVIRRAKVEQGHNPEFEDIATIDYESVPAQGTSTDVSLLEYRDKEVEVGGRYQYYIVPVNEDGVRGDQGNMIAVTFSGTSTTVRVF